MSSTRFRRNHGTAGGKVETVQKMDKKAFSRIADKRHSSGFYANVIFNGTPAMVAQLQIEILAERGCFPHAVHGRPSPRPATGIPIAK
jgi:ribosomal protein S6